MPSLLSMPGVVMDHILKEFDFREIQTLRKVCHDLRNFIDDHKPDAKASFVFIIIHRFSMTVRYINGGEYLVGYRASLENNINVSKWSNHYNVECPGNYMDRCLKDVELLLNSQTSPLSVLSLATNIDAIDNYSMILKLFTSYLSSRTPLLKAKEVRFVVHEQDHMLQILPYLDSNVLEVIVMDKPEHLVDAQSMKLNEVLESEQWKKAKTIWCNFKLFPYRLEDFEHLARVGVCVENLQVQEVEVIRQKLLHSSTMTYFCFTYETFEDKDQYLQSIGTQWDGQFERSYFRIENSSDVLEVGR